MLNFLPKRLKNCVEHINCNLLYELRVRAGKPLSANLGGQYVYLGEQGVSDSSSALLPTEKELEETVYAASDYSVYAVENQLKEGFLTGKEGERIGIAGAYVYENGRVLSIRAITSLCIRVPHEIRGCAEEIYTKCFSDEIRSLLILAPPGDGKTTVLRDLCRLVSERTQKNILVSDERGELSAGELGKTSDVIRFADKLTAFTAGIRAMRPDIIVTDELLPDDYKAVKRAIAGGISVFASAHLKKFSDVPEKIFSRYVLLDGLGKVGRVLDEGGKDVD